MRKYRLYKYDNPVIFEDEDGEPADARFIDDAKHETAEMIGVEYGESIDDVAEGLMSQAEDDLEIEYEDGAVFVDPPQTEPGVLYDLVDDVYDYELKALVQRKNLPGPEGNFYIYFGIKEIVED